MNRWYFWVLAPVLLAAAFFFLSRPRPPSVEGKVIICALSGMFILSAVGLADPVRLRWAWSAVATGILITGVACLVFPSIRGVGALFWTLSIPALVFLLRGRTDTLLDVIVAPDESTAGSQAVSPAKLTPDQKQRSPDNNEMQRTKHR